MTGCYNGALRILEELLKKPLTRSICLLHTELALCHVVVELDGTTKSPDAFSGPIGSQVSEWEVENFKKIHCRELKEMLDSYPSDVVEDLSHDQHYGY